jgi:hypothetical protein
VASSSWTFNSRLSIRSNHQRLLSKLPFIIRMYVYSAHYCLHSIFRFCVFLNL